MSTPLDYASPRARPARRRYGGHVEVLACVALCAVVLQTCVRIEEMNWSAGGYLPRAASADGGKWQASRVTDEMAFRASNVRADPTLMTRPLSPAERETIRQNVAVNRLREVVGRWGVAQYVLVPPAVVLALRLLVRGRGVRVRVVGAVCLVASLAAGTSVFYRGYLTALGW